MLPLKQVEILSTFPPMETTCKNLYSLHVQHLCRSAPATTADHAIYLRFTAWIPPHPERPLGEHLPLEEEGGAAEEQGGGRRVCFLLQAFALANSASRVLPRSEGPSPSEGLSLLALLVQKYKD